MEKPSQPIDETNEPGEISLEGLNPSFSMEMESLEQPGSPESGEIGEMSRSQAFQMRALVPQDFSLTETAPVPSTQEAMTVEMEVNNEPYHSQANQPLEYLMNDQKEKALTIKPLEQHFSHISLVENESIANSLQYMRVPLEENNQIEQQANTLTEQQPVPFLSEEQLTNAQPDQSQANQLVQEQPSIARPKEQPLKLLVQQFPMDNQPKQQPKEDKCLQLHYQTYQQKAAEYGDFQKQPAFALSHQVREPKLEAQQLSQHHHYHQADQQMNHPIQPTNQQTNIQQQPTVQTQQIQDNLPPVQENIQVECKQGEHKQIIEILEDMEHDEDTPVFGVPNNVAEVLVEETQKLTLEGQRVNQVQGNVERVIVAGPEPIPIDLEGPAQVPAQVQVEQAVFSNPQPITIPQQPVQQTPPQQTTSIANQPSSHPSPHQQKTQIIIQSQQQQIIVPQKVPQPPTINQTMKLNAQNIRSLLLQTQSDWTDIIRNASEAEILQFYEELTNKIEVQGNEQGEQGEMQQHQHQQPLHQQMLSEVQVILEEKPIEHAQQPQPIQEQPIIPIPQQQPSIPTTTIQQHPPTQIQPQVHPNPTNQFQQFQLITAALYQTSPELKQQIMKLSNQQLRALYRETMQQNRKKEQTRTKNKKKKNAQQAVIDLEDDQQGAMEKSGDSDKMLKANGQQEASTQQQPQKISTFSYLAQYQKRKSQSKKSPSIPTTPLYVNKTLLYSLIKAHDYQHKLKSILMPKQSIKYQEKTEKEVALLYLNHLRKNNIQKGPFETTSTKVGEMTVLCRKKDDVKGQNFRKMAKEGLCVRFNNDLSEERKQRILQLRQQRIQGMTELPATTSQKGQAIPLITTLPSTIPLLSNSIVTTHPAPVFPQLTPSLPTPRRRYCLIVQEQLSPREQEEMGLQSSKKRVKKSSNPEEEKELFGALRRMIELE